MTTDRDEPQATAARADDFRRLTAQFEEKAATARAEARVAAEEQRSHQVAGLIGTHVSEEQWRSLVARARNAASQGQKEFLLLRFPSQLCSDGGRAINVSEPDWSATLRGEAAELYLRWERDLKPQRFHLAARVLDFPGGMPGDIGLFLVWHQ